MKISKTSRIGLALAGGLALLPWDAFGIITSETNFIISPFYDVEGRVGMQNRQIVFGPEDISCVYVDGEEPYLSDAFIGFNGLVGAPAGTPLAFKVFSPEFSGEGHCITGYLGAESYAFGSSRLAWLAPVKGSEVELRPFGTDRSDVLPEETDDYLFIEFDMSFSDSRHVPSMYPNLEWIPDLFHRSVTITIEYLPGNNLVTRKVDTHIFKSAITDGPFADFFLRWGDIPEPQDPSSAYFGEDAPVGPMDVHFKLDGYTTETLHLDAQPLYSYTYNGVVTPNMDGSETPGPSPSDFAKPNFPEVPTWGVVRRCIAEVVTCGCVPTVEIEPYLDSNDDTLHDAADLIRAMRGEPEG
ncbi:MAG: hypothetical protein RLY93_08335 [Sumerlaeia bacterium]